MTTLEKIRAEILNTFLWECETEENLNDSVRKCLEIIDKYAEQEPTEPLYRLITDNDNLMLLEDYKTGVRTVIEKRIVPCDDVVSRQAIILLASIATMSIDETVEAIKKLPSVRPQEQPGHWIEHNTGHNRYYSCSKCSCLAPNTEVADGVIWKLSKYCPDCGAKMVEPQERSDKE